MTNFKCQSSNEIQSSNYKIYEKRRIILELSHFGIHLTFGF